jgi:hypothetical protein
LKVVAHADEIITQASNHLLTSEGSFLGLKHLRLPYLLGYTQPGKSGHGIMRSL